MRFFIFFLLFVSISFGAEKKVVLAAYGNLNQAKTALVKLKPKFSQSFQNELASQNSYIKARKSGKMYIMVIEPLKDYNGAKRAKSLLPTPYNKKALISNFSKSSNLNSFILDFGQTTKIEEKPSPKEAEKEVKSKPVLPKEQKPTPMEKVEPKAQKITKVESQEVAVEVQKKDKEKPLVKKEVTQKEQSKKPQTKTEKPAFTDKKTSQTRSIDKTKNRDKQPTYLDTIFDSIKNLFSYIWNSVKELYMFFYSLIVNNQFFISLTILIISAASVFIAMKQKDDKAEELDVLEKHLEEKAILVESIQIEMNHLKTYYNNFTTSVAQSVKVLSKHFNQMQKEYTINSQALDAMESITTVLNSHEEFSGDILLDNVEFNLNQIVDSVVKSETTKCGKNINLILDFNLPILERVMGDSARLSRIFRLLIDFMCTNTPFGRIIISLLEVTMSVDSVAKVRVSIKGNKNGFDLDISKRIEQAMLSPKASEGKDFDMKQLVVIKRLLNIMGGDIKYSGVEGQESMFFFDFELRVMNRYSLKDTLYHKSSVINLETTVLGKSAIFNKKLKNELSTFNIDPSLYVKWANLYRMKIQDTYSFMDLVIIDYRMLEDLDMAVLIEQATYKNFSILIITDDKIGENIKNVIDKKYLNSIQSICVKILSGNYNIEELKNKLASIQEYQKPIKLV